MSNEGGCCFFHFLTDRPTVLLSGATDFQVKIWSILDGSNPVTLKGHTAGMCILKTYTLY
jgi:hypothetical protein